MCDNMFVNKSDPQQVVYTMEADSFIQVLQRFVARRGTPQVIRSDQGRNFVRANKEISAEVQSWNKDRMQKEQASQRLDIHPPLLFPSWSCMLFPNLRGTHSVVSWPFATDVIACTCSADISS